MKKLIKNNSSYISTNRSTPRGPKVKYFFLELLFNGLNMNAKRIKLHRAPYFLDVHRSEIFIINEKVLSGYKSRIFKRRLLFFSNNNSIISEIEKKIKSLKIPDEYTGKGIYSPADKYKTLEGKKKRK